MEQASDEAKMGSWPKPAEAVAQAFVEAVQPLPGVEARKMFGCPCAFYNGNMFAGAFGDRVFFRLGPDGRDLFLNQPGAAVFTPMGARPMREYVQTSENMAGRPADWAPWLDKALAYATALPPKVKKPPRRKKG